MKWSRYAKLFKSKRNGWLLYHSATNTFLEVEENAVPIIWEMIEDADQFDVTRAVGLYFQLRAGGFLVEETGDLDFYNLLKMRRLQSSYAMNVMNLTIAPTRNCNFGCPYCYESNRTKSMMTDEVIEALIRFIQRHEMVQNVLVSWYGGEPLMAYSKIKKMTAEIEKLGKNYQAAMITNGYLLTPKISDELNDLKISTLQITIDGDEKTHNSRRFLIGGGESFDRILKNIDTLFSSTWTGHLNLRVNVDATNHEQFVNVYHLMQNRYEDFKDRITIYPGFVHDDDGTPQPSCFFDSKSKGEFVAKLAKEEGIVSLPIFPKQTCGGCTLTQQYSYVVGPDGEIYKCWHDVGKQEKVIGTVNSLKNWNMPKLAEGMISGSFLEDENCKECFFFPICDGGCPQFRMLNARDGKKRDNCSYFKDHLEELLEAHYEQKHACHAKS